MISPKNMFSEKKGFLKKKVFKKTNVFTKKIRFTTRSLALIALALFRYVLVCLSYVMIYSLVCFAACSMQGTSKPQQSSLPWQP